MQKMWMGWSLKKDKKGIRMRVKIAFQADDCGRKSWRRNISRAKRITQLFFLSCYCWKIKFESVFSTQTHTYDHLQPSADSTPHTHPPTHTHTKKGRVLWTGGPDAAAATWTRTNNPMTPLITGTNNTSSNRGNDAGRYSEEKVRVKRGKKNPPQLIGDVTMKHGHVASFNRQRTATSWTNTFLPEGKWPSLQRRCVLIWRDLQWLTYKMLFGYFTSEMVDVAFHLKLVSIFFSDSAPGTFAISAECDTSIGSNDPSEGFFFYIENRNFLTSQ